MRHVKDGFTNVNVKFGGLNECLSVKILCGGIEVRALIDTGCMVNVVYKEVYDKMRFCEGQSEVINGELRGIGNMAVPIVARFGECVEIGGIRMNESDFYVLDGKSDKYDVLLGYKFLKENGIIVHPEKMMIERKVGKEGKCQLYLSDSGGVECKLVKGVDVLAIRDVKLCRGETVSVEVGWRANTGVNVDDDKMFLVDGQNARYRVKRVAYVFDGVLDMNNPKVCVQVRPDIKKGKIRGIHAGDVLGSLYSVVDVDCESGGRAMNDWKYDDLIEMVKLKAELGEVRRQKILRMLWERRKALSQGDEDFVTARLPEFKIVLTDDTPIYQRPRHFPLPVAREIEEQCEELEKLGVLEESMSPWNSPIVPVRKPDGRLRMCIDYRKLNERTVKDRFPMCVVSECVYSMYGMRVFTKMDLVRGYYQMPVEESSRCVTAFSTARKHYQFRNLSFGLANAPAAFQRAMNVVMSGFPSKNVMVFIDDILIMSESFQEHLVLVNDVLRKLEEVGVKVKVGKCEWFRDEVEFLGHKVSATGVRKADKFIEKVREFPQPRNVRELRGFLGLVEFGRKFMKDCSGVMKPLTEWTGKKKSTVLRWNDKMTDAFEKLKEEVARDVELAYPDYSEWARPLEVYTDASGYCMGGCLMQDQVLDGIERKRVIAYVSKAFSATERKYSTIERELAALRFCLKTLRPFLYGVKFIVRTDHQPLVYLQRMRLVDSRLARTLEDLSDFDYVVEYMPGNKNELADLMSRIPGSEDESDKLVIDPEYLPKGLVKGKECKGGGDSMFEGVLYGLQDLMKDGFVERVPESVMELRSEVMGEVMKRPEQIGIQKVRKYMKELKAMSNPGVSPFQEVLAVVSKLFKVLVCVHYGGENPVVYRGIGVNGVNVGMLHLQCLSGVHYNWVIEKKCYERKEEWESAELDEVEDNIEEDVRIVYPSEIQNVAYCAHEISGRMALKVRINDKVYCGLIDTGAQVSLVSADVVRELEQLNWRIPRRCANVKLNGIGEGKTLAWEEVTLEVSMGTFGEVEHKFLVLEDGQMPYCFLIGIEFLRKYGLSVDVGNERLMKDEKVIARMQASDVCAAGFVGLLKVGVGEEELLTIQDVEEMQEWCPMINRLKECILEGKLLNEWPTMLMEFKKYASRFVVCMDVVYFVREMKEGSVYVPVFSLVGTIGMTLIVHNKYGHMGKFKLWECMKGRVFNPWLRKIVNDVATTCEECQKRKIQRMYAQPPILKLEVNEPFELMAIDCVSFPVTANGYVGMIVMVDHKSKFVYGAPVKNKSSKNVARVVQDVLLPMCIRKPQRMLSDNGPEFVGRPFQQMLDEWGIEHVRTTPYMPSSNGLAERTIRTLSEMLRMMSKTDNEWDEHVGRVLSAYNMTVHSTTGISPCEYVLNFERFVRSRVGLSENDRNVWREASKRFASFKVGDKVLKGVQEKGRLNVNKMREKFEGPYVVKKVMSNGVSYVLEQVNDGDCINEVRAHQVQLRPWREPPEYLREHPVYDMVRMEESGNEARDESMEMDWEGKELVLIERRKVRKSKDRKNISGRSMDDKNDFSGFWWDTEGATAGETYSVCKFPLYERESVLAGLRDLKERVKKDASVTPVDLDSFCEELDEIIKEIREVSLQQRELELEEELSELSRVSEEQERRSGSFYGVNVDSEPEVEKEEYKGPCTRSRGRVEEYEWIMNKGC